MSLKNIYPEKIPEELLEKNHVDDIILYALGAFGPLQKAEFKELNKTTFYKYLNKLIDKGFIFPPRRTRRTAIYEITPSGQAELMRRLGNYTFDFYEMIALEKKKIKGQVSQLSSFFEKYKINDDFIKIEFLSLYNTLVRDKSLSIFSIEQFNKLLLYLVLNDMKFFTKIDNVLSIDKFIEAYDLDTTKSITKTDIQMIIQEVVDKERYGIKIFKVPLKEETFIFFREDSEFGIFFGTIIKMHLRNLNYLKSLNDSEIFESDLEDIKNLMKFDLIKKYKIFNEEIEEPIFHLIEDYITELQIELHEKPFFEIEKTQEYYSLYSPFIGFTHPFKPLSEEKLDISSTFQRIKENEPKNERLSTAYELFWDHHLEMALVEVNKCLELDPTDYYTLKLKSEILFDSGDYETALRIYEEALNFKDEFDNIYEEISFMVYKARIFVALKRYDEGLVILNKNIPLLLEVDEEESYMELQIFKLKATIFYQQEKYNDALIAINKELEYLESSMQYDEETLIAESLLLKSKILSELKEYNEFMLVIRKFMPFKLQDPKYLYQISKISLFISPLLSYYSISKAVNFEPENKIFLDQLEFAQEYPKLLSRVFRQSKDVFDGIKYLIDKNTYLSENKLIKLLNQRFIDFDMDHIEGSVELLIKEKVLEFDSNNYIQISSEFEKKTEMILQRLHSLSNLIFYLKLVEIYTKNNWKDVLEKNLIKELSNSLEDDEVGVNFNYLLEKAVLIRTKENRITIDEVKFEEFILKHYVIIK